MVPAFVGQTLGLFAAHVALLGQNAMRLGATLYLLMSLGRGWSHLAILIAFGGLSIVGALFLSAAGQRDYWPHLQRWSMDTWHPYYQYSSSIVQFFWVPNHALPGWWLATLLLLHKRSTVDVATVGVSVAALAFWSPLAVLPFVPWLIFVVATQLREVLLARRAWVGIVIAAAYLPILAYLLLAPGTIAHNSPLGRDDFLLWYVIFILFQLPVLRLVGAQWRDVPREWRALFVINGLILLVLPFFKFGPNNDLVMRGSITSLVIVAFVFGALAPREKGKVFVAAVAYVLIAFGSVPAIYEVYRAITKPSYAISACSLQEASLAIDKKGLPSNYIAPATSVPDWLIDLRGVAPVGFADRPCWPDRKP